MVVEAGTLKLVYTDSPQIVGSNIKPGWTVTKEVIVENTGTLDTEYNIIWQELTNEITNNEMFISATCQRLNANKSVEGICGDIAEKAIYGTKISKSISIESGITHKYTFTFTFKETNASQNYNQGKKFNGVLGIEENTTQFNRDSWQEIVANVKSGNIASYNVGDTKEVDLGEYGKNFIRIANTSTPSECSASGFSQTACGFVLEFEDIITNYQMNTTDTNVGGWPAMTLRTFVNNSIYNSLPTELKNGITDTIVVSGYGRSDSANFTSTDKLYLLSPKEIYSDWFYPNDTAKDSTRILDYYQNEGVTNSTSAGATKMKDNIADKWWLRTAFSYDTQQFFVISSVGAWNGSNLATNNYGVSPAFRIG